MKFATIPSLETGKEPSHVINSEGWGLVWFHGVWILAFLSLFLLSVWLRVFSWEKIPSWGNGDPESFGEQLSYPGC
jgi:hypothetical protein